MELEIQKAVKVNAKTISIYCKVRDEFTASILDQNGNLIYEQDDGYVWDIMPGDHGGDYLILEIDIETGQINNWEPPKDWEIVKLINGE